MKNGLSFFLAPLHTRMNFLSLPCLLLSTLLHTGISPQEALQGYRSQGRTDRPSGRFGQAAVVYNDTLFMYGGTDGGHNRHGRQNFEPGGADGWACTMWSLLWLYAVCDGLDVVGLWLLLLTEWMCSVW